MNKNKRVPASQTHKEMVAEWKTDPAFKAEYDALEEEYQLLYDMVSARKRSGLKQSEVAERMGTKASAIARLEATTGRNKHSPTIETLRKYANAIGYKLNIEWKPIEKEIHSKQRSS